METDRELLEMAAKAVGVEIYGGVGTNGGPYKYEEWPGEIGKFRTGQRWNPLEDDGDRLRLARTLKINIDFHDCCAWKRLSDGSLIQEFWGGEHGDEAHAVVRAAAAIGKQGE